MSTHPAGRSIARSLLARFAAAVALGFAASAVSAAPASSTPTVGGPGGTPFRVVCPSGTFLTGIRAKTGRWIDRIGPVCAAWDPVQKVTGPARDQRTEFGGAGGAWTRFGCPPGSAVAGWMVEDSRRTDPTVVGNITAQQCRLLSPPYALVATPSRLVGDSQLPSSRVFSRFKTGPIAMACPDGQVANGLHGGSGSYLDRIGLICTALPSAANPGSTSPPAGGAVATARDDVDVYDQPDGNVGKVIGVMARGESHRVVTRAAGWSQLDGVPSAGRRGWVANDHLTIVGH